VRLSHRHLVVAHTVDLVRHAHRDAFEAGEHVELGEEEVGEAVDACRVAGHDRVEPAATAWSSGRDAVLRAHLAQVLAVGVEELGRERTGTYPGRVRLQDPDHPVDARRTDAGARTGAAGGRVRGR